MTHKRPAVLVVEGDPSTRTYLADALRTGGFNVKTVGDGLAALRAVERHRPDALLLNVDLPLLNGFAVHTTLQQDERTKHLPIVIITAHGMAGPSPVAASLAKPIPADDLVKVMFEVLARHQGTEAATRNIVWLCPQCGRVSRETEETGDPMTSEMRADDIACFDCRHARTGAP